ncbi:MAG: murein biosynthesis integral membrane protein MurJ [Clostridia bacterium]
MKKNNLVVASIIMLVFSIISKVSGFLREMTFAYFYGASNVTDAYVAATTISVSIFAGITVAVSTGYIPSISTINREKVSKTTSNIINTVIVLIMAISILGVLFAEQLIPLYAVDFTEETKLIAANMTRIILPFSFLYVTYNVLNGYMQIQNVFWTVGVATVINNFVNMITFAISRGNTSILAYGYALSWVLPSVFLVIVAKTKGFKYSPVLKPNDEVIKHIVRMGVPIFFGQLIFQFNSIVDKNFASMLGEGVMTIMKYANQLILFVTTIFVVSIVTAIYPTLAKLSNSGDFDEYKKISSTSMNTVLLLVIPVSVAFFMLANQIVEIAFLRGEFSVDDAKITSQALMAYSLGLPAISLNEILNKQFYSLKDTKTPVLSNAVSLCVNIVFNFALISVLKHVGLALATSLANTVLACILYYRLQKKIGNLGTTRLLKNIVKISFSALIMGAVVYFVLNFVSVYTNSLGNTGNIIEIISAALIGAPIYFVLVNIFKVEELNVAINFVKTKISRKKA